MAENENRNRVDEMFNNKTVLVSGGTGYMGKVLIEKILRTCPSVKRIYTLVRKKKGKDPQDRLKEIFNSVIFDLVKNTVGEEVLKKVVVISGDVLEESLGLSREDRATLRNETNIIYHLAATIRFNDTLTNSVLLNVRGTRYMLDFAKECKDLIVFHHVSTAYTYPKEKVLHDKLYPPPADPHMFIKLVEWMDPGAVDSISQTLLNGYPNNYVFSKALAEGLVNDEMDKLPVIISRPSIVIPVWQEPVPGWTDNINGPTGLLVAAGKGVLRTMYCDSQGYADFIPVDIAVNALLVTTLDFILRGQRRVYNCTSSTVKVTWEEIIERGRKLVEKRLPFNGVVWYPGGSMKRSKLHHQISVILFHYIPAIILDSLIFLSGNKPVLWKIQQRITRGSDMLEYYANNRWEFKRDGLLAVRDSLTQREMELYKLNEQGMDLDEYLYNCTHAARLYMFNEGDETIPAAKRHMAIMLFVDRLCKFLLVIGSFYLLYQCFIGR
ncbi:hypothetical protein PPYR_03438 [Photinus pyralis]|uniref:Fatty acyl-CoA reductase n=1 Tax=Photinus pyralis TaxID=7054 RepID=A0A5N4A2Y1_PHOPY|nr:fatty acyl-CoA reductase 1-like [Photinus pyralis]XP_031330704.1 fatty acyl-CoA reductase 1-like [Photinus pyralis]XP_031330705.1 fatty acyl-CoA reductase 1-like [Photinus pyralis]KAB0791638.1 hypothetical protein PPYR_03438 [Photinus pyralis]